MMNVNILATFSASAAYISAILNNKNLIESGDFASLIASKKLENYGPYKKLEKI